jgi:hypothetical protein
LHDALRALDELAAIYSAQPRAAVG